MPPVSLDVPASDRDRERTAEVVTLATGSGHLDLTEADRRLAAAWSAGTRAELDALLADLPARDLRRSSPAARERRAAGARKGLAIHAGQFVAAAAVMLTIWLVVGLAAGAWYFWPVWPIGGSLIGLVAHTLSVRGRLTLS